MTALSLRARYLSRTCRISWRVSLEYSIAASAYQNPKSQPRNAILDGDKSDDGTCNEDRCI